MGAHLFAISFVAPSLSRNITQIYETEQVQSWAFEQEFVAMKEKEARSVSYRSPPWMLVADGNIKSLIDKNDPLITSFE